MIRNRTAPLLALPAFLMAAGCSSECYDNRNALPLATFAASSDPATKVAVDSIQVAGAGAPGDSILWDGSSMQSIYLPFRIDSDTTEYRFTDLRTGISDMVTFVYDREPRFVSAECGVSYVFSIRSISSDGLLIDSVACPSGEITNANTENLIIYLRDE